MNDKQQAAFTQGYRAAVSGVDLLRAPFDTNEEATAYNEGFQEGIERLDDLRSDVCE